MKYQNYSHSVLQRADNLQQLEALKRKDAFFFCLRRVNIQTDFNPADFVLSSPEIMES